ncbi:hypothetical protein K432DRAFT_100359 [Lepidopterella palustris CBS 459.81]|uniref:Uncharacterized protein n=1 Tax=Lepidopterella palustris CBS 459.81 TaxID=1314670 RepID=A0A8E2JD78_9PEZI|nr:hypothetical protein K432DRAFT_100359 [Lepidopterella palustris CBS 459.81]
MAILAALTITEDDGTSPGRSCTEPLTYMPAVSGCNYWHLSSGWYPSQGRAEEVITASSVPSHPVLQARWPRQRGLSAIRVERLFAPRPWLHICCHLHTHAGSRVSGRVLQLCDSQSMPQEGLGKTAPSDNSKPINFLLLSAPASTGLGAAASLRIVGVCGSDSGPVLVEGVRNMLYLDAGKTRGLPVFRTSRSAIQSTMRLLILLTNSLSWFLKVSWVGNR